MDVLWCARHCVDTRVETHHSSKNDVVLLKHNKGSTVYGVS